MISIDYRGFGFWALVWKKNPPLGRARIIISFTFLRLQFHYLNVIVNYSHQNGFPVAPSKLKTRKQVEVLHSPIRDVRVLLNQIKEFNYNLYICCLLTYGCLLRPHQEIRLLKWSDFSDDLRFINLSGDKVKSKRNRIVPVPKYIREILQKGKNQDNIFSNSKQSYNKSYFSLIWRRFKRRYPIIEPTPSTLLGTQEL